MKKLLLAGGLLVLSGCGVTEVLDAPEKVLDGAVAESEKVVDELVDEAEGMVEDVATDVSEEITEMSEEAEEAEAEEGSAVASSFPELVSLLEHPFGDTGIALGDPEDVVWELGGRIEDEGTFEGSYFYRFSTYSLFTSLEDGSIFSVSLFGFSGLTEERLEEVVGQDLIVETGMEFDGGYRSIFQMDGNEYRVHFEPLGDQYGEVQAIQVLTQS